MPEMRVPDPPPAVPESKSPVLGIEYGNKSTRATLQIDLGSQDVQVEMTGIVRRDSVRPAAAPTPLPPQAVPQPPAPPSPPSLPDSSSLRARRIVDSASVPRSSVPDSVTRRVVGAIRRAQEAFYKGRYQEADAEARRSVALWPTAEGWALLGSVAWVRGDKEDARRSWLRARDLDPDFPGLSAMLDPPTPRQEASP